MFGSTQLKTDEVCEEGSADKMLSVINHPQTANNDPAAPNSDTFADLAVIFYPIHIDFEEEW